MDTSNIYPKPHPQTAGRVFDGEAVLILSDTSEIQVLNLVGSLIFELSDGEHSVADIARSISNQFEITFAEAEVDALDFLEEMVEQNVMILETKAE